MQRHQLVDLFAYARKIVVSVMVAVPDKKGVPKVRVIVLEKHEAGSP